MFLFMRFTALILVIATVAALALSTSSAWRLSVYPWGFADRGTTMPSVIKVVHVEDKTACKEKGLHEAKTLALYLANIKLQRAVVVCSKGCEVAPAVPGAMVCDEVHRWTGEGEKYAIQD